MFKHESKEEKEEAKVMRMLLKYHLTELTDPDDIESMKQITSGLAGCTMITAGTVLAGTPADVAKLTLLRAIVEQNFVIIRQLDRLNRK